MNLKRNQKKAVLGFAVFLLFMAVCTVVSKGIYKAGLSRVSVVNTEKRKLVREIAALGTISAGEEYGIYVPEGLRVKTVFVKQGDKVAAGDRLFWIDTDDLRNQIREKEQELKNTKASLADFQKAAFGTRRDSEKAVARLKEDYDRLVREQNLAIERKRVEFETAKSAREQAEMRQNTSVSTGDGAAEDLEGFRQAERQAAIALEDAILAKETALLSWKRQLEDAGETLEKASAEGELAAEDVRLQGQILGLQQELKALYVLENGQGYVLAQEAGTVTENTLKAGERTPDTACLLYGAEEAGRTAEIPLTMEQLRYLSIGDVVKLSYKTLLGETRKQEAVIQYLEKHAEGAFARIELTEGEPSMGQSVTMKYTWQSDLYPAVIPVSALHGTDAQGYYVYVVEEQEGILGMEQRIRKIAVTVPDKTESYAAVESSLLTEESRIVTDSTKELSEGSVVRVVE